MRWKLIAPETCFGFCSCSGASCSTDVLSPLAPGLNQLAPHLGSEVGEEGRPNFHQPCLCSNGNLLAMSSVKSAP